MNSALLLIDVQQSLVDEGIWNAGGVIKRLNQLISKARNENIPVIFVRDTTVGPDGSHHSSLDYRTDDLEIEKDYSDSFMETPLDELLKSKNISNLIVGGMQTDYCVDSTVRQAATLGYKVLLVTDGHSTLDHQHLKAEQIIAHHNLILGNHDSGQGQIRLSDAASISF